MNEIERQAVALRLLTNSQSQMENYEYRLNNISEALSKLVNVLCLPIDVELSELVEAIIALKSENNDLKNKLNGEHNEED